MGWSNWARDQHCAPAAIERPGSVAEIADAIGRAAAEDRPIRVAGAGHSFSDIVPTSGHLLLMDRMTRVLDADREGGLVKVEAGITLRELSERLEPLGLALRNLGDINVQTISGAISTGTHGTGARLPNLSAEVAGMELVLADGSVRELTAGADDDLLRAARISLGALGVIATVTLRCVPLFRLHGVDRPLPLDAVLDDLDAHVDGNDHFEFFTFPHSPLALTRTNNRTDEPVRRRPPAIEWANDVLLGNYVWSVLNRIGRARPAWIPRINRGVSRVWGLHDRVDRSDRIFASPRLVRFTEMEYAIPREHAAEAVRRVRALSEGPDGFHTPFPIELRFVAPDDAYLSPANGRDTAYVAVHMFKGMEWRPYFEAVEAIMDEYEGRPHWGKRHFQTAATLRGRYPDWDRFAAARAELDPEGRFANRYVERVLGPARATAAA